MKRQDQCFIEPSEAQRISLYIKKTKTTSSRGSSRDMEHGWIEQVSESLSSCRLEQSWSYSSNARQFDKHLMILLTDLGSVEMSLHWQKEEPIAITPLGTMMRIENSKPPVSATLVESYHSCGRFGLGAFWFYGYTSNWP